MQRRQRGLHCGSRQRTSRDIDDGCQRRNGPASQSLADRGVPIKSAYIGTIMTGG
jgi:hypothetical protein